MSGVARAAGVLHHAAEDVAATTMDEGVADARVKVSEVPVVDMNCVAARTG